MKLDDCKNKPLKSKPTTTVNVALFIVLLMELPIRVFLQPDPWLLDTHHWYFYQPIRLFIEFALVLVLIFSFRFTYPQLLRLQRSQLSLLFGCMAASMLLFSALEMQQLLKSFSAGIWIWLAWLFSGFCIGVGQELLYRGLLYTSLTRYITPKLAAIVTTLAFVLAPLHSVRLWHYVQQELFIVVAILIAVYIGVSVFFQWLRDHSNSVMMPALVHGAGNAITWVAVFA
ncbi:hypothetical protein PALB_21580 [Pseudoalteromonas luteoviolacea B = ATCC 29581]|nr:hypothetical protein PALB_21580 [Pseudoalteromonas luteoviolacea B = ATCC 29581]